MKRLYVLFTVASIALLIGACAGPEPEITEVDEPIVTEEQAAPEAAPAEEMEPVEVAADGTVFDPPIAPERLPEGVWYCDMGTTHYAQLEQGEGSCPVCMMQLVEKAPAEAPAEAAAEEPAES